MKNQSEDAVGDKEGQDEQISPLCVADALPLGAGGSGLCFHEKTSLCLIELSQAPSAAPLRVRENAPTEPMPKNPLPSPAGEGGPAFSGCGGDP